jgi:hypothetical protein
MPLDRLNRFLEWPFKIRPMITFAVMMGNSPIVAISGALPDVF